MVGEEWAFGTSNYFVLVATKRKLRLTLKNQNMNIKEQITQKRKELDDLEKQLRLQKYDKYIKLEGEYIKIDEFSVAKIARFKNVLVNDVRFEGTEVTFDETGLNVYCDATIDTSFEPQVITKEEFLQFLEDSINKTKEKLKQ